MPVVPIARTIIARAAETISSITAIVTMSSVTVRPRSSPHLDGDVIALCTLVPRVVDGHDVVLVVRQVVHARVLALRRDAVDVVTRDLAPRGRRGRPAPHLVSGEVAGQRRGRAPLEHGRLLVGRPGGREA